VIYWDTSALIFFLAAGRFAEITGVTRAHALTEFYSTTTGKGFKVEAKTVRLKPQLAADLIHLLATRLSFVNLDAAETAAAIAQGAEKNILGGRTHDLLHATAARKAGATEIWTCNDSDFAGLSEIPLKNPARPET
jgi:predicted nucleic acid-binding protein